MRSQRRSRAELAAFFRQFLAIADREFRALLTTVPSGANLTTTQSGAALCALSGLNAQTPEDLFDAIRGLGQLQNLRLHAVGYEEGVRALDEQYRATRRPGGKARGRQLQKAAPDDEVMAMWRRAFDERKGERKAKANADADVAARLQLKPGTVRNIRQRFARTNGAWHDC